MTKHQEPSTRDSPLTIHTIARILYVRLRFPLLLIMVLGVLVAWERLTNLWDRVATRLSGAASTAGGVSPDTEYFCPMCPGVLSFWPEKCPVCKMPLVRRKKGDAALLPSGVLARMQLSPQRIQLAGIKTTAVIYQSLAREFTVAGRISLDEESAPFVTCQVSPFDAATLKVGQAAELTLADHPSMPASGATIRAIRPAASEFGLATVEVAQTSQPLKKVSRPLLTTVNVTFATPVAELPPFDKLPRNPPPLTNNEPRAVNVCAEHPEQVWTSPKMKKCPFDGQTLEHQPLNEDQRVQWWCPAHPHELAHDDGICSSCGDRAKLARIVTFLPPGQVVAVPVSAVIDTGDVQIVYVESMPGMFDGVAVEVGPRCGEFLPVLSGLAAGQRVASAGAFLIDAETRLTTAVAASYFGAGSPAASSSTEVLRNDATDSLSKLGLSPNDLACARWQKVCPVTKQTLGSMGKLISVHVGGRVVYLCCSGCAASVKIDLPEPRP